MSETVVLDPRKASVSRDLRIRSLKLRFAMRYRVVWGALVAIIVVALVSAPAAVNGTSIKLITALGGVLVIAAVGQLLVMMLGGIDLSVAAVVTLAAAIVVRGTNADDGKLVPTIIVALAVTTAIGLVNGITVTYLKLNSLIVTLAMGGIVAGAIQLWTKSQVQFSASGQVPPSLHDFTTANVGPISAVALVALLLVVVIAATLRRTRLGRQYVATGTNRRAAKVAGARTDLLAVGGFAAAGFLFGVGGILVAGYVGTPNSSIGAPYLLETIVAVALGGAALSGGPASLLCTSGAGLFLVTLDQYLAVKGASGGVSMLLQSAVLVAAVALVTTVGGSSGRRRPLTIPWRSRGPRDTGA